MLDKLQFVDLISLFENLEIKVDGTDVDFQDVLFSIVQQLSEGNQEEETKTDIKEFRKGEQNISLLALLSSSELSKLIGIVEPKDAQIDIEQTEKPAVINEKEVQGETEKEGSVELRKDVPVSALVSGTKDENGKGENVPFQQIARLYAQGKPKSNDLLHHVDVENQLRDGKTGIISADILHKQKKYQNKINETTPKNHEPLIRESVKETDIRSAVSILLKPSAPAHEEKETTMQIITRKSEENSEFVQEQSEYHEKQSSTDYKSAKVKSFNNSNLKISTISEPRPIHKTKVEKPETEINNNSFNTRHESIFVSQNMNEADRIEKRELQEVIRRETIHHVLDNRSEIKHINLRFDDAYLRFKFRNENMSVDIRLREQVESYLTYLDVQRLHRNLQAIGVNLDSIRINGLEFSQRSSKSSRKDSRERINIKEDADNNKKASYSPADSVDINLLL